MTRIGRVSSIKRGVRVVATILLVLLFIFPVYWVLVTSLKSNTDAFSLPPKWIFRIEWEGYRAMIASGDWGRGYLNSILITTGSVLLSLVVGSPAAYSFSRFRLRSGPILLVLILMTRMIPPVALVVPLYAILRPLGLIDRQVTLIVVYSTMQIPYVVWMMKGFFSEVPLEIEEAALADGADRLAAFIKVVLPLSAPGLIATGIFCSIISWNELFFALLLSRNRAVTIPMVIASNLKIFTVEWSQMAAGGVLASIPVVLFGFAIQRYFVKGLLLGSVKG